MAFSILNTPKKLGNSLLRRAAGRKTTTKNSPRGSARRSPRIATTKSPKGKVGTSSTPWSQSRHSHPQGSGGGLVTVTNVPFLLCPFQASRRSLKDTKF